MVWAASKAPIGGPFTFSTIIHLNGNTTFDNAKIVIEIGVSIALLMIL